MDRVIDQALSRSLFKIVHSNGYKWLSAKKANSPKSESNCVPTFANSVRVSKHGALLDVAERREHRPDRLFVAVLFTPLANE